MSSLVSRAVTAAALVIGRRSRPFVAPTTPDICTGIADLTARIAADAAELAELSTLLSAARATRNLTMVIVTQRHITAKLADLARGNQSLAWVLAQYAKVDHHAR